jgi:hypothetical protein
MLTKILGCKRDDVTGDRRKRGSLRYVLSNIIRVIKSRRWARHVASMGNNRYPQRILFGKPEGKDHLEDLGVDARMILTFIFKKWERGRRV